MLLGRLSLLLVYAEVRGAMGSSPPAVPGSNRGLFLDKFGPVRSCDSVSSLERLLAGPGRELPNGAFCCLGVSPGGGVACPVSGSGDRQSLTVKDS